MDGLFRENRREGASSEIRAKQTWGGCKRQKKEERRERKEGKSTGNLSEFSAFSMNTGHE